MITKRITMFLMALFLGASWVTSTQAFAATFTVTTTADSGAGSLREAIATANSAAGADTITFSSLFDSAQTISIASALPAMTEAVTVTGPGAKLLTVKTTTVKSYYNFTVNFGVSATFSGLTISDGLVGITNFGGGTLTVTDCAFTGTSNGIYNTGTNAASSITRCTFSGNAAGFVYQQGAGTGTLTNCTFNGNSSGVFVGLGNSQFVTLTNCTVSGNTTGISNNTTAAVVIQNSIVALNGTNISGPSTDGGNNYTGSDPKLDTLKDNGGQTATMALLSSDSPAFNAGNDAIAPATDQRGVPRPQGVQSDIGAFELEPPQSLVVTTTADENDGTSNPDSGAGTSLREAIIFANSNADTSTITFNIAGTGPFTLNLGGVLPELSTSINIHNETGEQVIVTRSTGGDYRIFKISNGTATGPTVDITNLTISNGKGGTDFSGVGGGILNDRGTLSLTGCILSGNSTADFGSGGAIFNNGFGGAATLTVTDCTFSDNSATINGGAIVNNAVGGNATLNLTGNTFSGNSAANGGGIVNTAANGTGTLTVASSTFSGNSATTNGGGIYNNVINDGTGTLTVTGSTFSGNSAADGGGVYNNGESGTATLTVNSSTLSSNTASTNGGGIYNRRGTVTLETSTLSSNTAATSGGGIYNESAGTSATLTITNSTLSSNTAATFGAGIFIDGQTGAADVTTTSSTFSGNSSAGGGIVLNNFDGTATLTTGNSIFRTGASGANIVKLAGLGTVSSQGYNLSNDAAGGDGTTAPGGFLNGTGDKRNTDPLLGALADNGGPTFTHLPAGNSPALNSGNTSLAIDQRGISRPQGAADDIGSVEVENQGPNFIVTTTEDADDGNYAANDISLREAINFANANADESTITFSSLFDSPQTIAINPALPALSQNVTITGPGANLLTIRVASGQYNNIASIFKVNAGVTANVSGLTFYAAYCGIENSGTVEVSNCVFYNTGSGVDNKSSGVATITDSTFTGIYYYGIQNNGGQLTVSSCTLYNNSQYGVLNRNGAVTINNCTISGNNYGVGHEGASPAGTTVNSCTIINNYANGILNEGVVTLQNSIVTGNGSNITNVGGATVSGGNNFTSGDPDLGPLAGNGGPTLTYLPNAFSPVLDSGSTSLSVDQRGISRPQGASDDIGAVEVEVENTNTPPIISDVAVETDEDTAFSFAEDFFDAGFSDGQTAQPTAIKITTLPAHGVLTLNGNAVTADDEIARADLPNLVYTPDLDFNGDDSFDYNASDGTSFADENATVNITINAVNDAPTLDDIPTVNGDEGTLISFVAVGNDADSGAVLTYSLIGAPSGATIDSATGEFRWTPSETQGGQSFTFQVQVIDGEGGEATQSVTINVAEVNVAPVLPFVGARTLFVGSTATFNFAATDSDLPKNTLTYSLVGAPSGASINATTGVFSWTPIASQANLPNNFYRFKVRVTDNGVPSKSTEALASFTVLYPAGIAVSPMQPSLKKIDGKSQSVTLVYTVRNNTNTNTYSNLRVQGDVFWPATLSNVELTAASGTSASQRTLTGTSRRIVWNIPSLPAGTSKTLSVKLTGVVPLSTEVKSRIAAGFVLAPVSGTAILTNIAPEVFLNTYK